MSTTQATGGGSSTVTTEDNIELEHVGFELEYPATTGEPPAAPADENSYDLSMHESGTWPADSVPTDARGRCGTDHCGAEIRSGVMELHSDQPENWYRDSIEIGEGHGYTFAASGEGRSRFGLHTHLSPLAEETVEVVDAACDNEWARVFFCSSVSESSLDPWRHYNSSSPQSPFRSRRPGVTDDDNHYEFRLQEPVLPEHFDLVVEFWRKTDLESPEAAVEWARELVHDRDERLTAIQQYHQLDEQFDDWPDSTCVSSHGGAATTPSAAEWFRDLME